MCVLSNRYHFSNVYRIVQLSTYRYEEIIQFSFERFRVVFVYFFCYDKLFEIIQPVEQKLLFTESSKQPLGAAGGATRCLTGESPWLGTRSDRFSTPCPPALPASSSNLFSANVHVPHSNPTIRGTGDELPRELKVTQRLHPVTVDDTHQHWSQYGKQTVSTEAQLSPLLESALGIYHSLCGMGIWILV